VETFGRENGLVQTKQESVLRRPGRAHARSNWLYVGFIIGWALACEFLYNAIFLTRTGDAARWAWYGAFAVVLFFAHNLRGRARRMRQAQTT